MEYCESCKIGDQHIIGRISMTSASTERDSCSELARQVVSWHKQSYCVELAKVEHIINH